MCQVISKVLSNFHSLYFSYFKGRWACLPLISWNQTRFWSRFIPQGSSTSPFPTIPSHLFRFGFIPTGSGLLAFVFFWSFKFFLLQLFSPCVLACSVYHAWPTLPQGLMCCPCPVPLRNLINCGSSLYPQLGDQLHLWAFPRGAGWCFTCSVMDLPQPKTGRKIWGNQKIMCGHLLLYTLLHLYCLSIPDDFWVLIS